MILEHDVHHPNRTCEWFGLQQVSQGQMHDAPVSIQMQSASRGSSQSPAGLALGSRPHHTPCKAPALTLWDANPEEQLACGAAHQTT